MTSGERARRVLARADVLGRISEEEGALTRRFATRALSEAADVVEGWMREAGLVVRRDAIGNVIGRGGGEEAPLVIGSHFDTVRDAGRFDGALGVLCAIELAELRGTTGATEVAAFADEEGVRFGAAYLGSAAYRTRFDPTWLDLRDPDGCSMAEAIEQWGGDVAALRAGSAPPPLAGYVEVHIEQGPVLEHEGLPVGVVTAIAGQTRGTIALTGAAGHAGTVPPALRRDALAGAAELVLAVEQAAKEEAGLVATVGSLVVEPGASNVVPGRAVVSLDVRHPDDARRTRAVAALEARARAVAERRGLELDWRVLQETASVAMDDALTSRLAVAIHDHGLPVLELVSGAGHDAAIVGRDTPAAMLFVRCAGGVSHSPAEQVSEEDVAVALEVLTAAFARQEPATVET